ncbi:MAG: fliO [Alphaproteobacteria bacterium]|nr:fliO [Alphaproteobacteria bacterium]
MNPATDLLRAILALVFVLGLIWLLSYLVRKYGGRLGLPAMPMVPNKERRLQLLETLPLDGKNRLVLIRRDEVEHLVLIGSDTAQVVEGSFKGTKSHD